MRDQAAPGKERNTVESRSGSKVAQRDAATVGSWRRALSDRLASAWVAKMLATVLGIGAFFLAYFWVLRNPQDSVVVMPLTAIDRMIPVEPRAMPLYLSLWFYVSIAPALLRDARDLARYGLATFVVSVVGLGIFLFWPTTTPDFGIDWARYPSMEFLKRVDVSANACPSLHVAFAVFTGLWLDRLLREIGLGRVARAVNLLWCLGILYSTLAVRQHVLLDVLAGAALGAAVALAHRFLDGRRARRGDRLPVPSRAAGFTRQAAVPATSAAAPSRTARAAGPPRTG